MANNIEYQLMVKYKWNDVWWITGMVWTEYVKDRKLEFRCKLQFVIVDQGPIYLIDYDLFNVSSLITYELSTIENRPRAYETIKGHTEEYAVIHREWFDQIKHEITPQHRIWANDLELDENVLKNIALAKIEIMLKGSSMSLQSIPNMPYLDYSYIEDSCNMLL